MPNPFLCEWDTPFGTPPFGRILVSHYLPAIRKAIRIAREEIKSITNNTARPDFFNTVEALEKSGQLIGRITPILFSLHSAETSSELQAVAMEVSPLLTRLSNDISLNRKLFKRVAEVYAARYETGLSSEQLMLIENRYRSFIHGGASLSGKYRKRFREISEELSTLSLSFEEKVLEETNAFELHLTDEENLAGLSGSLREHAAAEAKSRGKKGWVFTLHFPSYFPFMQYSEKRELRETMYRAYMSRGVHENKHDNRDLIIRIVNLRLELARILGYKDYASLVLEDRMADSGEKVLRFLDDLYSASEGPAKKDVENVRKFAARCGHIGNLERWDWAYYSEKLKKELYSIDDEILRPYFSLDKAENAIFRLAGALYGIRFEKDDSIPVYNKEVRTFRVYDRDNTFLGIFYADYHPRPGKSGGAWMTSFRDQQMDGANDIRPFISVVANFVRPGESRPSLLSFSELTTFLHEFGHSLHGILSRCTYESLSGTNVARDFVELPSQFMENFAYEKKWLDTWAEHFETGERIPPGIIAKIKEASTYNEGYACFRQLGFALLDMAWHTLTEPLNVSVSEFEDKISARTELFNAVSGTNLSASFGHIFGGGYAAGYYGYKWAEVLDADAFSYFTETGIFNTATAESFRKNILEKGGTEKPMNLYLRFRGKEPDLEAFLKRSGLI